MLEITRLEPVTGATAAYATADRAPTVCGRGRPPTAAPQPRHGGTLHTPPVCQDRAMRRGTVCVNCQAGSRWRPHCSVTRRRSRCLCAEMAQPTTLRNLAHALFTYRLLTRRYASEKFTRPRAIATRARCRQLQRSGTVAAVIRSCACQSACQDLVRARHAPWSVPGGCSRLEAGGRGAALRPSTT